MTPEQEEQVRRALRAAAEADEPVRMPPEVADRLDAVLADLSGSKEQIGADDELGARRRRRWPNALVAAAAVAVIAVAGAAVATNGFGALGGQGGSTSADRAPASKPQSATASTAPSTGGQRSLRSGAAGQAPGEATVPQLHRSTLAADIRRLVTGRRTFGGTKAPLATTDLPVDCARPFTGHGSSLFVVALDGRPATLVVAPARNGRRQARVYSCQGAGNPLASVSVPIP